VKYNFLHIGLGITLLVIVGVVGQDLIFSSLGSNSPIDPLLAVTIMFLGTFPFLGGFLLDVGREDRK